MANITTKKVAKPTAKIAKKAGAKTAAKSAPTKATKGSTSSKAVKKIGSAGANAIKRTTTFVQNRIDDPRELQVSMLRAGDKIASTAKKAKSKANATLTQARGVSSTNKVARGNMRVPKHDPYNHLNSNRGHAKKGETQYEKDKRLHGTPFADWAKNNPDKAKEERFYNAQTTVMMDTARRNQARKKDAEIANREKRNGTKRVKK